ncbi:MAG: hypothetical protein PHH84_01880 [Oscillospiraceae bacterium]|nr:hypothetical protein [Oscillospiraceae bacterium]MDD4413455.1 hypothetical protein [Oscillospiraceae bacterium]
MHSLRSVLCALQACRLPPIWSLSACLRQRAGQRVRTALGGCGAGT